METKGLLLGISLATVMVAMVEEEASKVLTTVLTTPLMMLAAAAAAVAAVGAAAVVAAALAQLSVPFRCAEKTTSCLFNISITNIL